jgi:hypothetical protein
LKDTFVMMQKIFIPSQYMFYTMRENNYLIAALLTLLFIITYWINNFLENRINSILPLRIAVNCIKFSIIILFVFTFLRPISQFIYFQF